MREQYLRPKQKRRLRPRTTESRYKHRVAENWLAKMSAPIGRDHSGKATIPVSRQPKACHRDRGIRYACTAFNSRLAARGITPNMSRRANPYDNALAESFGDFIPPTKRAASLIVVDYIETFYKPHRRHSALGYLSPLDFEKQMFPQTKTTNLQT